MDKDKYMNEISRLVLPTTEFIEFLDLFVRKFDKQCVVAGKFTNANMYKFDTWMNMFAPKKHYFYCDLGDIYLKLNIEGQYKLQVVGSNRNAAFYRLDDILVDIDCENDCCVKIPNARNYEGIYYTIIEDKENPIKIKFGAWCTDKAPQRENKLAAVICTFKREEYVYKNIKTFEKFIDENPKLKDKIKLIIADNGKTLDVNKSNDKVKIIPNMNAGGAGGFTRGLIDVIEQNEKGQDFTRVLFMDDDVEIFPESFYRTLTISNYLKDEYKESFINGAMLYLYDKRKFYENLALQNDLWVSAYYSERSLEYDNILTVNDIPKEVFENENVKTDSAWWFHCFDISMVKEKGLPSPVFFRGDDVEWSWRNFGQHHISMNGICIWHAPFVWRVSKVADYYYLPRNMFFINSLYTPEFKKTHKNLLSDILKYLLKTYDYTSLEILMQAFKDILKGSDAFRENPEEQFKELNAINKKTEWFECDSVEEMRNVRDRRYKVKKYRKLIYKLTNHGINCPFKFLFKKRELALDWHPPVSAFALVKEVKVYNLLTHKYEIRKFDRKKLRYFQKEGNRLINEIEKNYDKLHEDYLNAHKEFTTMEFWKKYLEI